MKAALCEKVMEVRIVSGSVMSVVFVFREDVLRLRCRYALQNGSRLGEKRSFYDEFESEWRMPIVGDLVVCFDD